MSQNHGGLHISIARRMLRACVCTSMGLVAFANGQTAPGTANGAMNHNDTRVHPGYSLVNLVPPGAPANWPRVSGMDFLPNGDLAVSTWDGFGNAAGTTRPGRVFIFKNVVAGDSALVTYTQFGTNNMNEPLGLKVEGGEIYIIEKDSLVQLADLNKDQVLDGKLKIAGGWTRYLSDNTGRDLSFAHGLVRLPAPDSRFIIGLATRWNEGSNAYNNGPTASTSEKGCILGMRLGSPAIDTIACGIRSPDGIALGPEDGIFVTDNHGHYVPASKMVHVKQGRFFNVRKSQPSPFENNPVTPPVLWLPHGTNISGVSVSPTQPLFLRTGTFKGQMIAGDNNYGTLQRYFLEKVGGEYQGAVFRFSGGLRAAAHRLVTGPDDAVYVGGIGATGSEWGGWAWSSRQAGLQKLKETGAPFFDVLAVRSTGSSSFELEFTEPVVSATTANFPQVQHWSYTPVLAYGSGKGATQNLTVQSVTLSDDKKKITLVIPGLVAGNVVFIRWADLAAVSGRPLWTDRAWYTLNAFGPGEQVVAVAPEPARRNSLYAARALPGRRIALRFSDVGVRTDAVIRDARGKVLEVLRAPRGAGEAVSARAYAPGIYLVTAGEGAAFLSRRVTVF